METVHPYTYLKSHPISDKFLLEAELAGNLSIRGNLLW
jgi:hypothetical protein